MARSFDEIPIFIDDRSHRAACAVIACMVPVGALYAADCSATALLDAWRESAHALTGGRGVLLDEAFHHALSSLIALFGLWFARSLWIQPNIYAANIRVAIVALAGLAFGAAFGLAAWTSILDLFGFQHRAVALRFDVSANAIVSTVYVVGLAPVVEEILFRGWLFQALRRFSLGPVATIAISSFAFGIIHLSPTTGFVRSTFAFAVGLLFGMVRHVFRNVLASMAVHSGVNLAAVFFE